MTQDVDYRQLIRQSHYEAELERLRAGYEGCSCAMCQEFYHELDLAKYGERVKRLGDTVVILAGKDGADKWTQYHQEDSWSRGGQVFYTGGMAYGVADDGRNVRLGQERIIRAVIADPTLCFNIPIFDRIIELEREQAGIRAEDINDVRIKTRVSIGTANKRGAVRKGDSGSRPVLYARHRAAGARRAAGKGISRRLPQQKQPRLFA